MVPPPVPFPVVPHFPSCPISQHASLLLILPPAMLCLLLSSVSHCFGISLCAPSPIMPRHTVLGLLCSGHSGSLLFHTPGLLLSEPHLCYFFCPAILLTQTLALLGKLRYHLRLVFSPRPIFPALSLSHSFLPGLSYSNGSSLRLPHCMEAL